MLHGMRPGPRTAFIGVGAVLLLGFNLGCERSRGAAPETSAAEITVAAAANLTEAFEVLAKGFTERSGIRVVNSFGSTASLAKQIENGGPFDVFAAADVAHVDELDRQGLLEPGTRALYARGRLVLWMAPGGSAKIERLEDLARPEVRTVALAKPELAPYGQAALETLRALNLWPRIEPKAVYAENVSETKQFAASGNADAAFIPLALTRPGDGRYLEVEEGLHQPIDQAIAVIRASNKRDAARQFEDYVLSEEGQAQLLARGYSKPAAK